MTLRDRTTPLRQIVEEGVQSEEEKSREILGTSTEELGGKKKNSISLGRGKKEKRPPSQTVGNGKDTSDGGEDDIEGLCLGQPKF